MTNREDLPETVAVPVGLLEKIRASLNWAGEDKMVTAVDALIPKRKPKPRLVAFDLESWHASPLHFTDWAAAQPDLLTLLDDVADTLPERWTVNYPDRPDTLSSDLKARIRTALGVTE